MYPKVPNHIPPQHQNQQPGIEFQMNPNPIFDNPSYVGSGKLGNKVALITGGDSGIGKAVAIAFAKEGANVSIVYLNEDEDASQTKKIIEGYGRRCLLIKGDLSQEGFCSEAVDQTIDFYGKCDILVNNAAVQYERQSLLDISSEQLEKTFQTNVFSFFYTTKALLPHLKEGSSIINTASVTAYEGNKTLLDYSSSKGAVVSFTRSLALNLVEKEIRVNAVAPGPIWTPLIPASYDEKKVSSFGINTPMKRPGQPFELAPTYVYLASEDSNYVTGQVLHVNGGIMVSS
ncbi:SDR family oxidoreductase [Alkalibaculum bacchi]|uniref:SDR family oxidoreductase n=1 Tax=Alkalibaculum bacchi TaxID=645887 RepID=UPI0026ED67F1|nr:SDR family oxidoreductase [Alkalibaculum bacchi]